MCVFLLLCSVILFAQTDLPRKYVIQRSAQPVDVDGKLEDLAWSGAKWTETFGDIEGDINPHPYYDTQVKLTYDDDYLYVGAYLEDTHIWASQTKKNTAIFNFDCAFELFLDPDGDHVNYYEFQANPLNTIWELSLPKPYRANPKATNPDNIEGLKTATHVYHTINDPSDQDSLWSIEMAIPWSGLEKYYGQALPPQSGSIWRMNLARVQWGAEIEDGQYFKLEEDSNLYWTWSPHAEINLHTPEYWGYLIFDKEPLQFEEDLLLDQERRLLLMEAFQIQKNYYRKMGTYNPDLSTWQMDTLSLMFEFKDDGYLITDQRSGLSNCYTNQDSRFWCDDVIR